MSRPRILLAVISLAPFVSSPLFAQDAPAKPKVKLLENITYAKVGDVELKLDLAMPAEGDGPYPGIVAIHGGAWRAGSKGDVRGLLEEAARRGYVAISPQYRFCPKDLFPAQVHDVKAAVRWLRVHAKEYRLNPEKIGATGFSAGGHLALMLGVTDPSSALEGPVAEGAPSSRVQAVVNYFGPTDFAADDIPDVSKGLLRDFLGGTPASKPSETKAASPITFVTRDDPPILTFQGTKDPLVPPTQAETLAKAMTAAGVGGRVELLIGAGHGWAGVDMARMVDESFAFFDLHLKK